MRPRSFLRDRKAVTSVFCAASAVAMMAVMGLVVDAGDLFTAKRRLQGTTDLAAIAGATDLPHALQAARANAVANGYDADDIANVELGTYTRDPSVPMAARFQPSALPAANALRVTMTHAEPVYFGQIFALAGGGTGRGLNAQNVTTQGIAATQNVADFSIGSRVAAFNGGVVNAVLGATVGGSVNLSVLDYNALAGANVDLFGLANAVALQIGQVGGTYGQAFSATVPLAKLLTALASAAPGASGALQTLIAQAQLSGATIDLSRLLEFGPYANVSITDPEPHVSATASVMSILQAAMQLGGAPHLINLNIAGAIPGIASVTAKMSVGEPPQGSTIMAVDRTGSTVHTAQVRVYFDIGLLTLPPLPPLATIHVPLYVEVGYGTATLASLSCNALDASSTNATLNVTPGLLNGWIGKISDAQMVDYTSPPVATTAQLLNVAGLVTVTDLTNLQVGNASPTAVAFSNSDIQAHTIKTANTTDYLSQLVTQLLTSPNIKVNGLGAGALQPTILGILAGAAGPVDQLLAGVLQSAGVGIGQADTWINGAHCGAAALAG